MNVVDIFSGAGGMSLGFEQAGFKTLLAVESDPDYAKTYQKNFKSTKMLVKDIQTIEISEITEIISQNIVDVLIGGPPCQGFSIAGNIGRKFLDDSRNYLFLEFARFVEILNPRVFVLENVARMMTHNDGKTLKEIVSKFLELGYEIKYEILNSSDYGVPQHRRRIFIVGTLKKNGFVFPNPSKSRISIKDAIDDLPPLGNNEQSNIPNHSSMNHSTQMLTKMKYVKDGGNRFDIPHDLRPNSGDARKYIRYNSNLPSFCVTGDMRKIFHYNQNRALTPRELARLQTFPDKFVFEGNSIKIQQQIGNAVPPLLAKKIAIQVRKYLNE